MMTKEAPAQLIDLIRKLDTELRAREKALEAFKRTHPQYAESLDGAIAAARLSPGLLGMMQSRYSEVQEMSRHLEDESLSSIEVQERTTELLHKISSNLKL